MQVPETISPDKIIDALVEIRFETSIPSAAIFGSFFNIFRDDFPNVQGLPILQLPEQVREKDKTLEFNPHHRLTNEEYAVQIGPKVLTISCLMPYKGWKSFSEVLYRCFDMVFSASLISHVSRLGIHYINFFDQNIFDHIDINLLVKKKNIQSKNMQLRYEIAKNDFQNTIQIANKVSYQNNGIVKEGSIIDIDTFSNFSDNSFIENYKVFIEKGHQTEKELFFDLLNEEFLSDLNPKYK